MECLSRHFAIRHKILLQEPLGTGFRRYDGVFVQLNALDGCEVYSRTFMKLLRPAKAVLAMTTYYSPRDAVAPGLRAPAFAGMTSGRIPDWVYNGLC